MQIQHGHADLPDINGECQDVITDMTSRQVTAEYYCLDVVTHPRQIVFRVFPCASQCTDQQVPPHLIGANKGTLSAQVQLGANLPCPPRLEVPKIQSNQPINNPNLNSLNHPPHYTTHNIKAPLHSFT